MRFKFCGHDMPALPGRYCGDYPYKLVCCDDTFGKEGEWAACVIFSDQKMTIDYANNFIFPEGTFFYLHFCTNSYRVYQTVTEYPFGYGEWGEGVFIKDFKLQVQPRWNNYEVKYTDAEGKVAQWFPAMEFEPADNIVVSYLNVDFKHSGVAPVVPVMQGDEGSRLLRIALYSGGQAYQHSENTFVRVGYNRADGRGCQYYVVKKDISAAAEIVNNIVTVPLIPEMTKIPGKTILAVQLEDPYRDEILNTFTVILDVQPNPALTAEGEIQGDDQENQRDEVAVISVSAVRDAGEVTVTAEYDDGSIAVSVIALDDNGDPISVTKDGVTCALSWEGFDES